MSMAARYEWRDQQAALTERLKNFLLNPGKEQFDAVLADMTTYADAARSGNIDIPTSWNSVA